MGSNKLKALPQYQSLTHVTSVEAHHFSSLNMFWELDILNPHVEAFHNISESLSAISVCQ